MKVVNFHLGPYDAEHSKGAAVYGVDDSVLHRRLAGAVDATESQHACAKSSVLKGIGTDAVYKVLGVNVIK